MNFQPGDIVRCINGIYGIDEGREATVIKGYPNQEPFPTHFWIQFNDNKQFGSIYHHNLELVMHGN